MFKKPFSFVGRISRTEYQLSMLIYVIAVIILYGFMITWLQNSEDGDTNFGVFFILFFSISALFLALVAQAVKRCHDVGKSGWWILIPLYGLWLLIEVGKQSKSQIIATQIQDSNVVSESNIATCSKCGNLVKEDSRFCPNCGNELFQEDTSISASNDFKKILNYLRNVPQKTWQTIIIICSILTAIYGIIGGIIGFLIWNRKDNNFAKRLMKISAIIWGIWIIVIATVYFGYEYYQEQQNLNVSEQQINNEDIGGDTDAPIPSDIAIHSDNISRAPESVTVNGNEQQKNNEETGGDTDAPIPSDIGIPSDNNTSVSSSGAYNGVYPQGSQRLLTLAELTGVSKSDLQIMRNEIFARHGYIFKSADMKKYFAQQNWYRPMYSDINSMLTEIEKKNVEMIKKHE